MENIIKFPIEKRKKQIEQQKDGLLREKEALVDYLEDLSEDIVNDCLDFLLDEGFDITNEKYVYDVSLFFETTRSLVFKMSDEHHPLQYFAHGMFSKYDTKDNPQLEFDF